MNKLLKDFYFTNDLLFVKKALLPFISQSYWNRHVEDYQLIHFSANALDQWFILILVPAGVIGNILSFLVLNGVNRIYLWLIYDILDQMKSNFILYTLNIFVNSRWCHRNTIETCPSLCIFVFWQSLIQFLWQLVSF